MKICESCGMPLEAKTTSKLDARYCTYCQDQKTGKLATKEEVREGIIQNYFMAKEKMNRKQAEKATDEMMTKLTRWKKWNQKISERFSNNVSSFSHSLRREEFS